MSFTPGFSNQSKNLYSQFPPTTTDNHRTASLSSQQRGINFSFASADILAAHISGSNNQHAP
jgi:hypothetical protein